MKEFYLPDIDYIDDFSDYNLSIMIQREFEEKEDLPESIILYQNTMDGNKYKLRELSKDWIEDLYEGKIV